jgi:hypothetical protein
MRNNVSDDAMFATFMTGCFVVVIAAVIVSAVSVVAKLVGVI